MSDRGALDGFIETWDRTVLTRPDAPFLIFEAPGGEVASWTYGDFDAVVDHVAAHLVVHGAGAGRAVHLALTNSPTFVATWLAVARLGAWMVPSDPMGTAAELADHLERTDPSVGLCSIDRVGVYREAVAASDRPMSVVEVDEADATFEGFGAARIDRPPHADPTDRLAVMFTSGTTGRPKGVEITQANYAFAGRIMVEAADLTAADRQLVVLPLFHANAQYYSFASAIHVGASVALMHSFSASGFLPQAARHGATCASLFAAPIRMILARGGPVDGLRLRHCWFAQNLADDQYDTISAWLGCRPRQLYGMTETIPAVLTDGVDDPRADVMGSVTPGCVVDVQDGDGRSVEPGEVGEVVVGGEPGTTLFSGYLDDPATTAASFRDGWFRTGDRATRDADGRHRFDGRRSDVLKVAGENVSIVEVETVLSAHPGVLEAAVVGAPDPVRDEVPVAFVVAAPGGRSTEDELAADLAAWCEEHLAKAKRPRTFTFLTQLPRTSVGKIRKFLLREEVPTS